jgi:hypothetical protein
MITVFGRKTTVGLVRFYSGSTAQAVGSLLRSLPRGGHGFSFDASDITATPVFASSSDVEAFVPNACRPGPARQ